MSMARLLAGERPLRAWATARHTQSGVDQTTAATLVFPSGAIAQVASSIGAASYRYAVVSGDAGAIRTDYANHALPTGALALEVKRGTALGVPYLVEEVAGGDGFRAEAESFARMARLGAGHWNGASEAESIDTVLALQAIAAATLSGTWVDVG